MTYFDFADQYFETQKDIYKAIKELSERQNISLFNKLSTDKNEVNFVSWLSEMKFGLRLDKVFENLLYGCKINNQTPDWFVNANEQNIIFEVVKINRNEKELLTKISNFKTSKKKDDNIIATMKNSGVLDGKYFYGNIDKILKKEISYRNIIEDNKYVFIVCVDTSEIDLFIFYNDFYDFFNADDKHGYFNQNISFGKNVSALFVQVPIEGFKLVVNNKSNNKLNEPNLNAIKKICD